MATLMWELTAECSGYQGRRPGANNSSSRRSSWGQVDKVDSG